jgi:hypothetical protein
MANLKSSTYLTISNDTLDRVNLGAVDNYIEGGDVVWVASAAHLATAPVATVLHYDKARYGEYKNCGIKPMVIIKAAANFSLVSYEIKDEDGNVLYTFDTDCSAIPKYVVLRLITTDRNTVSWELA